MGFFNSAFWVFYVFFFCTKVLKLSSLSISLCKTEQQQQQQKKNKNPPPDLKMAIFLFSKAFNKNWSCEKEKQI